jgi:hypothetical protein
MNAGDVLKEALSTFESRNAQYKHNADKVGKVMEALFPEGQNLYSAKAFHKWHLFELMVVKLTRFVNSEMTHVDSIRDLVVYGAMIEALIHEDDKALLEHLRASPNYKKAQGAS